MITIVLATPHSRNDELEAHLRRLPGLNVERIRDRDALTAGALTRIAPRYIFFPHWSWKIPADIFENHECVIFHMTDLPFGRGGSPLQNLISRGIYHTQLTALRCVAGMDAGPVYLKRPLDLSGTAEEVYRRASAMMAGMIQEIVDRKIIPQPQDGEVVTFRRRTPEEGDISKLNDLVRVFDFIRMLDAEGYPHAFIETESLRLEFTGAQMKAGAVLAKVKIEMRRP
jgi:methionyl-tRNA formyltransferase